MVEKLVQGTAEHIPIFFFKILACGGELTSEEGRFTSPGFPNSYPVGAECIWTIGGAPGNQIALT